MIISKLEISYIDSKKIESKIRKKEIKTANVNKPLLSTIDGDGLGSYVNIIINTTTTYFIATIWQIQ